MIKNNVWCFVATQVTACIQICNKEKRQGRREGQGRGRGVSNSGWVLEGKRERERERVRITDLNKTGHFCVASSDILWVLVEKRWREVKGREGYLGELGRGNGAERGSLVRAAAQSCIQWG